MFDIDKSIKKIIGTKKFGGRNDWDGDGVPNWKDCQPRNVMRQDKIRTLKDIELEIEKSRYREPTPSLRRKTKLNYYVREQDARVLLMDYMKILNNLGYKPEVERRYDRFIITVGYSGLPVRKLNQMFFSPFSNSIKKDIVIIEHYSGGRKQDKIIILYNLWLEKRRAT